MNTHTSPLFHLKFSFWHLIVLLQLCFQLGASGQSTAFTYQGRLNDTNGPATGVYDLRFVIYDSTNIPGNVIAGPLTNSATAVSNGLFCVTLDFGPGVFNDNPLWLDIAVRTNGAGPFTALTPRQPITPTPYAITAKNLNGTLSASQVSGTLPLAQLPGVLVTNGASGVSFSGTFTGIGAGLTNVPGTIVWQAVSGSSQTAQANASYLMTNANLDVVQLPVTASIGDVVRVSGSGAGGWQIIPNEGQSIVGYSAVYSAGDIWTPRANSSEAWYGLAADYDGGTLLAVGSYSGLVWVSHDFGTNWFSWGSAAYWPQAAVSANGNRMATFQQNGQIYISTDGGTNWTARGSSMNWDGIAMSADGLSLAASVYGGQIYVSTDGGVSWTPREQDRSWAGIAMSSDGKKLAATVNGGQIYTSIDGGTNWTAQSTNRNWAEIASSADGSKLLAGDSGGYLYVSTDSGVTWTPHGTNGNWVYVASSADGKVLLATDHGASGHIYLSTDGGLTWNVRDSARYWRQVAVSGDGKRLAAEVDRGYVYTSRVGVTGSTVNGAAGTTAVLQYLGNGVWQPMNEALVGAGSVGAAQLTSNAVQSANIAAGAVGSAQLAPDFTVAGNISAGSFQGCGGDLTNLNYNNITNPPAIPSVGNLVVTNDERAVFLTNFENQFAGTFIGDGSGVTNLDAAQLTSGTLPLSAMPSAVLTNNASGVSLAGTFGGNGSGLTDINANAIVGGLTTNLIVTTPSGPVTLVFTNGILRAVQ